jgi:peptidyl-prolyl cis-trans isomerase D
MLKVMRDYTKSLRWILWLIVLSFVMGFVIMTQGGLGGARAGVSEEVVAKVGKRRITLNALQDQLARQDQQLRQMLGQAYDPSRMLDPEVTLSSLVDRAVLLEEADRLGLETTAKQLADEIRSFGAFKDASGRFDREAYLAYLDASRLRPQDFEKLVAEDILVREMSDLMRGSLAVTGSELRDEWSAQNETASIEYAQWPLEDEMGAVTVTEEELAARHAADPSKYDAGPARQVRWVRFSRDEIRKGLEKPEEMRAYYDENVAAIYTLGPDQRRASTVLVAVAPGSDEGTRAIARGKADQIAARARAGEDFATLARELSEDAGTKESGGDLGPFYKEVQDPAVDAAVFAANEGDVVGPVETSRGYEVLKVTKGAGTKARDFEDVRNLIAQGLYAKDAAAAVTAASLQFQTAMAKDDDFEAAAKAAGVEAGPPTWVTRTGEVPGLGVNPSVTNAAFTLEKGKTSELLLEPGGQVVVHLVDTREHSPRSLDEARADVERDVKRDKARELARAKAEPARAAAASGTAFDVAVEPKGVQTAGPLRKNAAIPALGLAPDVSKKAFATGKGAVGPLADAPTGVVVFRVTDRVGFDEAKFADEKAELETRLRDQRFQSLRQATLAQLREAYDDEITTYPDRLPRFGNAS